MSWKNTLKEKLVDAARRLVDSLPTVARFAAYVPIVLEAAAGGSQGGTGGLKGIADALSNNMAGLYAVGGVVGAALLGAGALIRFLPGTSADLRQTAMKMIEGGIFLLAIIGLGGYILQGGFGIGKTIAEKLGGSGIAGTEPKDYWNPWSK